MVSSVEAVSESRVAPIARETCRDMQTLRVSSECPCRDSDDKRDMVQEDSASTSQALCA